MNGERTRMRKCNEGSDCMDGVPILHILRSKGSQEFDGKMLLWLAACLPGCSSIWVHGHPRVPVAYHNNPKTDTLPRH